MSPASGDNKRNTGVKLTSSVVSIQLMSPASGDFEFLKTAIDDKNVSIQLMSPASGDSVHTFTK